MFLEIIMLLPKVTQLLAIGFTTPLFGDSQREKERSMVKRMRRWVGITQIIFHPFSINTLSYVMMYEKHIVVLTGTRP